VSTVLLTALGFFMWPQYVGASFTAKSGDTLRRNAVIMPLYSITMPLLFFVAKSTVLLTTALALFFAIYSSSSLVSLLLLGYAGVAQFFPAVVLGLYSRRVTTAGVFAGLTTGLAIVAFLMLIKRDPLMGLNAGFIALYCNFAIAGLVVLLTPRVHSSEIGEGLRAVISQ
jgi:SSS family solute:Na+ symporter